jgi:hypothetical protein
VRLSLEGATQNDGDVTDVILPYFSAALERLLILFRSLRVSNLNIKLKTGYCD